MEFLFEGVTVLAWNVWVGTKFYSMVFEVMNALWTGKDIIMK
jgi:hypothetical protein